MRHCKDERWVRLLKPLDKNERARFLIAYAHAFIRLTTPHPRKGQARLWKKLGTATTRKGAT